MRINEPLKGKWWVIGGRVHKGESLERAAIRKVKSESSLEVKNLQLFGYYEDQFEEHPLNVFGGIHSVSIVLSGTIDDWQEIKLGTQCSTWKLSESLPTQFKVKSMNDQSWLESLNHHRTPSTVYGSLN